MEITICEALRLKNEIAAAIRRTQLSIELTPGLHAAVSGPVASGYGETLSDGKKTHSGSDSERFDEMFDRLDALLKMSNLINNAIDTENKNSGVSNMARELANVKLMMDIIGDALPECVAKQWITTRDVPGGDRVEVTTVFKPYISKAELKERLKALRNRKRELVRHIAKIDSSFNISVDFSYEDVDELL